LIVIPAEAGIQLFLLIVIPAKPGIQLFLLIVIPAEAGIQCLRHSRQVARSGRMRNGGNRAVARAPQSHVAGQ
jgi:hypothetical protein